MSKPGRPNLSLAGKRETPVQQKQARGGSANRGASRGRGGRGRGGGPRPKQELIQTGGVFSEGLGGDFPSRKKDKDYDGAQFSFSKHGKETQGPSSSASEDKKEEKKEPKNVAGKASFKGWDALWCSDDERDAEELSILNPKGFISDLRRGNVMPVVLPLEDQPQFLNVINKSARLSLEDDDMIVDEEKKPMNAAFKPHNNTAQEIIAMLEASTSELLHLQLPSVIGSICNNIEAPEEVPMETDDPANGEIPSAAAPPTVPHYSLPQGRKIGKLQVTQKGRLLLQIGGHSIDVTHKKTSGKQQGTVLLEIEPSAEPIQSFSVFSAKPPSGDNSLYYLGSVKHDLVGSMSWGTLNEASKGKNPIEVEMREDGHTNADDEKNLEELQKEQAEWATLAEKWACGLQTS